METGSHRIAQQRFRIEHERLTHEAVQNELVLGGIDLRHARMVALVMEPIRRNDAIQLFKRRESGAVPRSDGIFRRHPTLDVGLKG